MGGWVILISSAKWYYKICELFSLLWYPQS